MRRDTLSEKAYSGKQEKRLLEALGRGLLNEFPNPERTGCPGHELLRGIASRKVPLAQAEPWLEHLSSCSPCYRDFSQLRDAYQRRRNRTLLAIAASILVVASLAGWAIVHKQKEIQLAQTAVLDLRNRSVARGTEPNPAEQTLQVTRAATKLTILLPLGSSEGPYDVRIVTLSGESLVEASGTAGLNDHGTSFQVPLRLASLRRGKYLLQIRRPESEWLSFQLVLR